MDRRASPAESPLPLLLSASACCLFYAFVASVSSLHCVCAAVSAVPRRGGGLGARHRNAPKHSLERSRGPKNRPGPLFCLPATMPRYRSEQQRSVSRRKSASSDSSDGGDTDTSSTFSLSGADQHRILRRDDEKGKRLPRDEATALLSELEAAHGLASKPPKRRRKRPLRVMYSGKPSSKVPDPDEDDDLTAVSVALASSCRQASTDKH